MVGCDWIQQHRDVYTGLSSCPYSLQLLALLLFPEQALVIEQVNPSIITVFRVYF